jgi:sulfite exporter TauE/SafE
MNLWIIFITGLTVGGLTCLAVQGGLLASVIAGKEGEEVEKGVNKKSTLYPTTAFLVAKLISHTLLGFLLGAFGSVIAINQTTQILMQFVAGFYMLAIAMNLLNVHPIFRYAVIQPPRFLLKKIKNQTRSKEIFAPAMLGAMTIFIPCGTTIAMEALAISSANPFKGAAIMAVFVLGTTPLFFGVGWVTSILGDNFREKFLKVAAIALVYLAIVSINGSLVALGSPISSQSIFQKKVISSQPTVSEAEILVTPSGYLPNYLRVKKGEEITIKVVGQAPFSCAAAFRVPSLGVSKNLGQGETFIFKFTPEKTGKIPFTCSMGMYTGVIEVI